MKKILIATGNKGKLAEISKLLKEIKIDSFGTENYNLEEQEENGKNFAENSVIKAKYYGDYIGEISLADDSGLVIPAIDNQPGIYSARWAPDKNFNIAFETIKQKLKEKTLTFFGDSLLASLS